MAIFILFLVLLAPIALSFWTAAIGFAVRWCGGDSLELTRTLAESAPAGRQLAPHRGGGAGLQRGSRAGVRRA